MRQVIEDPIAEKEARFERNVQVIVVGLGVAGAAAAIGAAEAGATVFAIERTTGGGGSSALAAGYIYLGGGTHSQKANGFSDTAENMLAFLKALSPLAVAEKLEAYAHGSVPHLAWLESLGVPFNDRFYPGRHIMHLSDESLAWTGSEEAWPYLDKAVPAPRGHKVESENAGGHILVSRMIERCRALGVAFSFDSRVTSLIRNEARAVVGVRYRQAGHDHDVRATRGVILATGGFEWNRNLVERYTPLLALEGVVPLGAPTADGSGILLAQSAGAQLLNMTGCDIASAWYPPEGLIRGILVNRDGCRFINEDVYHGRSAHAVLDQPDRRAFLITDNSVFERPTSRMGHSLIDAWETVADMERDLKMPAGSLQRTMEDYNWSAALGRDPLFHKQSQWLTPLTEAPFAALDCSLGAAVFASLTMGGVQTTLDGEVIAATGQAIAGLYAAGVLAPSIAFNGSDYASGMLLGSGSFFGRRAGRAAGARR